jgi:hypothetical protein
MRDKAKENRIRRNAARKGGPELDPAKLKAAGSVWATLRAIQIKHRQRAEAKLIEKAAA